MFARLGEPGSVMSIEAESMMKQHVMWANSALRAEVRCSQQSMREAMHAYCSSRSKADFGRAMQSFEAVLAHHLEGWKVAQVGRRRYWEIDDRICLAW
jgi:predicted lipoprotein